MNIEKLTLEIGKRLNAAGWNVLNDCESGQPSSVDRCEELHKAVKGAVEASGWQPETVNGVPLWDWYAGNALQGILAGPDADPHWDYTALAVDHANKMMKVRKGSQ